MQLELYNIFH